jgi:hypothetical protein
VWLGTRMRTPPMPDTRLRPTLNPGPHPGLPSRYAHQRIKAWTRFTLSGQRNSLGMDFSNFAYCALVGGRVGGSVTLIGESFRTWSIIFASKQYLRKPLNLSCTLDRVREEG